MTYENPQSQDTTEQFSRGQIQQQFELLGDSPDMTIVPLLNSSSEVDNYPITTSPDGTEILAILEIPKDETQDGFLMIGRHPDKGYFIAGPSSQSSELDKAIEDRRDFSVAPLEIGSEDGTKITFGKQAVTAEGPVISRNGKFELPKALTKTLRSEFSDYTSRKHATIEIKDGKLIVTD